MAVVNIIDPLDINIDQGQVFNSLVDGSSYHESIWWELCRGQLWLEMKGHVDASLIGAVVVTAKAAFSCGLRIGQVERLAFLMAFYA